VLIHLTSRVLPDSRKRCGCFRLTSRCQLQRGNLSMLCISNIIRFRLGKLACRIVKSPYALLHLVVATLQSTTRRQQLWGMYLLRGPKATHSSSLAENKSTSSWWEHAVVGLLGQASIRCIIPGAAMGCSYYSGRDMVGS